MAYFTSVLVWMCIAFSMTVTLKDQIMKNGWITMDEIYQSAQESNFSKAIKFVAICAIPIFRLLVCICLFVMSFSRKDDWLL